VTLPSLFVTRPPPRQTITLDVDGLTHGGEAVGRLPDGKACFVAFAIPGERVVVEVVEERSRWARGRLLDVLRRSPDRVEPPCPYTGPEDPGGPPRCGGCAFQHVTAERQAELKRRIVSEQLQRIGGFADPPVEATRVVAPYGYRSSARFGVTPDGRLGFRRPRSNEVVAVDRCLLLREGAQRLREEAGDDWLGAEEVTVRQGEVGGALIVRPGPGGLPPLPPGDTPVAVVGKQDAASLRGDPVVETDVAGLRLRVSPTSFFQAGPAGAEALVELVREAAEADATTSVLDLYSGVGLFAAALAALGATVTAVEWHRQAARDARANLAHWPSATVRRERAEDVVGRLAAAGERTGLVVVDPPRRGAGPDLCAQLPRIAGRVVYVSCDPAALARDARAIADAGLELRRVTPVDQFAQTAAIEAVALFA
jgi:tRNA/tmRNA/rRNA uracil-C5-methylase (TrmA/RlmC/RlmD family)